MTTMRKQARAFIRHPADIPIEVARSSKQAPLHPKLSNISAGGLAFVQSRPYPRGSILQIRLPFADPSLLVEAQVVWCKARRGQYEIGVRFLDPSDLFQVRMVEQVCHIEQYKRDVALREGRQLSCEEAASEWIQKHASDFPAIH